MAIMAAFALLAFWFRDYMSLRLSPSRKATWRVFAYGASILLAAVLIGALAVSTGMGDFTRRIQSPPILFLVITFHVAASVPSIWVRRTQSYDWMWATGLLPAPIVWLLLLETARLSGQVLGPVAPRRSFFAVAVLRASSMIVVIFRNSPL
jgi:hypothetical protein